MAGNIPKFISYLQNHKVFKSAPAATTSLSNLVAVRDNDVITVSDKTVKYAILDPKQQSSQVYDLLKVDFNITDIILNKSGTLLAIVGEEDVVYCYMPTTGFAPDTVKGTESKKSKSGEQSKSPNSYPGLANNHKIAFNSGDSESVSNPEKDRVKPIKRILKVLWNSIASHDSNLVILSNDGFIRSYDIMSSHIFPEFEMSLSSQKEDGARDPDSSYTFDDDDSIQDPISIAFGSEVDPLGKLTLYILTKEGDVFGLCPWVPSRFVLTKQEVSDLFDNAVTAQYQYKQEHEKENSNIRNNNPSLRAHYRYQLAWTTDLWRQVEVSSQQVRLSKNGSLENCHILSRPSFNSLFAPKLQPQGPFRCQPFPDALYEGHAIDFLTTDSGSMTTLAVLYSTSRINFYLQDISLDMKWAGNSSISDLCLALIESVSLPNDSPVNLGGGSTFSSTPFKSGPFGSAKFGSATTPTPSPFGVYQAPVPSSSASSSNFSSPPTPSSSPNNQLRLIQTSSTGLQFYVVSKSNVYRVDISSWAIPLTKAIEESNVQDALSVVSDHSPTDIWVVLNSKNQHPVLGIGSLPDPFGTTVQFIQTSNSVYVEIPEVDNSVNTTASNSVPLQITLGADSSLSSIPSGSLKYTSLLQTNKGKELHALLDTISLAPPKLPRGISAAGLISPDVDHLAYFSDISNYFCEELAKLHKSGLMIHDRLTLQRSELLRQLKKVSEICDKVHKLEDHRPTNTLEQIFEKQEQLRVRSLSFLEKLSRRRTLLLSNQEKKWFAELQRSQERIYDSNGFERRVKNVSITLNCLQRLGSAQTRCPRYARDELTRT